MTHLAVGIITGINAVSNAAGGILLAPVAVLPGWLSLTVISALVGVLVLAVFKYTSNQKAIGRVRDDIKANLLAVKIFRDSFTVAFRAQTRVFAGAVSLLFHSLVPMLIIMLPVSLILAQMSLWYQARPLQPGDDAVTVKLTMNETVDSLPQVSLDPLPAAPVMTGPVRIFSKKEVYWKLKPVESGNHRLVFHIGDRRYEKQLAIGNGFMRVSPRRPGSQVVDALLYPLETPFASDEPVQSISIAYPGRDARMYGRDWWLVSFFLVSMACAFLFKPLLNVRI